MGALDAVFTEAAENPALWLQYEDDFFSTLSTSMWETVKDSGASAAIASDSSYGNLLLTSAATTDDDGALVQSNQEFVLPASGKRIALSAYVQINDAAQTELFFGLAQTAATNPENILTVSNRIGFQKNDGDASLLCKSEASDVETSIDSQQDMVDDTYVLLEILKDSDGSVTFYVDGEAVGAHITTNVPATELGVAMYSLSGVNTGTKVSTWDYVRLAVER